MSCAPASVKRRDVDKCGADLREWLEVGSLTSVLKFGRGGTVIDRSTHISLAYMAHHIHSWHTAGPGGSIIGDKLGCFHVLIPHVQN
jgi:hypothetical protein